MQTIFHKKILYQETLAGEQSLRNKGKFYHYPQKPDSLGISAFALIVDFEFDYSSDFITELQKNIIKQTRIYTTNLKI